MEQIVINGRKPLQGTVKINGAKNAAVAILPAALAANGLCTIENLPAIEDVSNLRKAFEGLGAVCEQRDANTLSIDATNITRYEIGKDISNTMRASYYLLGVLLGRFGKAEVPIPGGCNLNVGPRLINYHLKGFEALGATTFQDENVIRVHADKLIGAPIYLDSPSVGATINIMMAAVFAEGITTIHNAAKEPHVVDTANFLNRLGAKIRGVGSDTIRITGVPELHGGEYTVIPDPIETGTYMIAAAITGGDVTVTHIIPKHMDSLIAKLREMNCLVEEISDDALRVKVDKPLKASVVRTSVYPGFPTDLQPQITTLLCTVKGKSMVTETIYDNRFKYTDELNRLGANVRIEGRAAHTEGSSDLVGAEVKAMDLRAGAALVLAGLAARGETVINNIVHLDRGYERFEEKLRDLGADIRRVVKP
ncbi:MAG: UDP-N-acetylglucosamine 1-carboxyvinyltransferase [Defluviitaleaceae bacterium]|nr:UDP-N-acetylglucosamine 1-carboxyvinyltransferase [Defluviitaleaceae bacterium]MCL2240737.1 UDP-N-acetylglucosamine 1-carboxyvinyltransferase [Defluviitaleaceae bacterium]